MYFYFRITWVKFTCVIKKSRAKTPGNITGLVRAEALKLNGVVPNSVFFILNVPERIRMSCLWLEIVRHTFFEIQFSFLFIYILWYMLAKKYRYLVWWTLLFIMHTSMVTNLSVLTGGNVNKTAFVLSGIASTNVTDVQSCRQMQICTRWPMLVRYKWNIVHDSYFDPHSNFKVLK